MNDAMERLRADVDGMFEMFESEGHPSLNLRSIRLSANDGRELLALAQRGWCVVSDAKMTAEESCRQVLKTIADACDQESLARAGGYLFRYVQEETVLRDCGQRGVCRTPPGCARHWEERNRELVRENEVLRSNSDHLSSENASLASQVESMAMRIESLAEELAKPEDVRLRVVELRKGEVVVDVEALETLVSLRGGVLHTDEVRAALRKVGKR